MDLSQEKQLIKEAKRNPEAFGLLYDRYYQPVFRYILRRTTNIELTKDLTSETFFKALKHLNRFRWKNIPFSAWLYRIAGNEVNGFYRKQKKFMRISLSNLPEISAKDDIMEELRMAEEELERKKEFMEVHEKIFKLKPFYQTVITLRFFEKKKDF